MTDKEACLIKIREGMIQKVVGKVDDLDDTEEEEAQFQTEL